MAATLPIEIYDMLEGKVSKDDVREFGKVLTTIFDAIERKADAVVVQKKAEIKEELTKELSTKEDLAKLEGRLNEKMAALEGRLNDRMTANEGRMNEKFTAMDWKMRLYFLTLLFVIILTNKDAIVLIARLIGLVK